jgi:hypothetical protein
MSSIPTSPKPTAPWLERFASAIDAAEAGLPPLEVVERLSAIDPNMATPFGERFADPASRALRTPEAEPLLVRLLALVRRPTSTAEAPKLSREASFLRVRLARLLRLSASTSGFADVRVWPGGHERLRERSSGVEGRPEAVPSFGFSIFNPHVELPIGTRGVVLDDIDVWVGVRDRDDVDGGSWVPYRQWAVAQSSREERPRVITCPRCGVDVLSDGCSARCGA